MKNIDIARKLGVSTATVSLALNNKAGVSKQTKMQILELKTRDTYMSVSPSPVIQLVIHKKHGKIIDNKPFFANLVSTIQLEAMKYNYKLNVIHYFDGMDTNAFITALSSANVIGNLILATEMDSEDLEMYRKLHTPIVLLDSSFDLESYDSVIINNEDAIFQAVHYLIKKGHNSIGYLRSSVNISNFEHRYDGYRSALRYFGIENNPRPCYFLHCSMEQSYQDMKLILQSKNIILPSVFICDLDYIALGAAKALIEAGYRIPNDISIMGFDDIDSCQIFNPPISTIHVNRDNIGSLAVQILQQRITHPDQAITTTRISSRLVERASIDTLVNS